MTNTIEEKVEELIAIILELNGRNWSDEAILHDMAHQEFRSRTRKVLQEAQHQERERIVEWVKAYVEKWGKTYTDDLADDLLTFLTK